MHLRSALLLSLTGLVVAVPSASALPAAKHVPAPHVCADGSAPVRGTVGEDAHTNETGKGHTVHGNGFGYGHGCGASDTDGGGTGGDDGSTSV